MDQDSGERIQEHVDVLGEGPVPYETEGNMGGEGIGAGRPSVRDEPAKERQLRFLKKLGVEVTPGLTAEEASILIVNALLRRFR